MTQHNRPPEDDQQPFDPRVPGRARMIYTVVAVIVILSLIASIAGYALWERVF